MGIGFSRQPILSSTLRPLGRVLAGKLPTASTTETVESLLDRGDRARDATDWSTAAAAYGQALHAKPSLAHIWVQYGHALKESGNLAAALGAYRRALELKPDDADTHLQLGHALKLSGQYRDAGLAYLRSYQMAPSVLHARTELIRLGWSSAEIAQSAPPADAAAAARKQQGDPAEPAARLRDYLQRNADVAELIRRGFVDDAAQHHRLYGYREGRDILDSLAERPPVRAFVLCPSNFKRCGIGEHARYIAQCLESMDYEVIRLRTTTELLACGEV